MVSSSSTPSGAQIDPSSDALQTRIAKVHHDLKNPLSIIAGNAQFLLELDKALELDPQVTTSIRDIQDAVQTLEERLDQLVALKKEV